MKKYIYTILAVAAVFSSCSKGLELNEDINSDSNVITNIGASTELSTRAVVGSGGSTVNWETGDQLGVLGTNGSSEAKNFAYTLASDPGTTSGTFSNSTSDITTISAVMYPYQSTASWDGTNLSCEIPSVQTATIGSFDKAAAVMYSIGNPSTANVALNYAVYFLKVTIGTSDTGIHSITISSPSTELSGKMEITSSSITPVLGQSLKSVTLTAGKNITFDPGDYYIAIKAGDIENPTISYVYLDQTNHTATEKSKAGSGTLSFTSGKNVKPISVNFNTGTVTTREAVQLWENGPYWAKCNVGATSETAFGGYYAWGGSHDMVGDPNTGTSVLSGSTDTATQLWGANWRMPTKEEFEGLVSTSNCSMSFKDGTDTKYQDTDVKGVLFSGKNDGFTSKEIFLPAAGYYKGSAITSAGECNYWSSTPLSGTDITAHSILCTAVSYKVINNRHRDCFLPVRAVLAE